jgi:hypothetical protein
LARLLDPEGGPALRARLGLAARERVVQQFDATLHIGRMVELLRTGAAPSFASSRPERSCAPELLLDGDRP